MNGIRTKQKRLLLAKFLEDFKVGACILPETHLRQAELGGFRIQGYHIMREYCRDAPVGTRIGGGVLILVHANFSAERIGGREESLGPHIEHCSARFFPTEDPSTELRITGVYIPPSQVNSLTIDSLMRLVAPTMGVATGDVVPQLLGGDFNTTEWGSPFYEWTQEAGMQELVDPEVPTFALGSSLDKFLFVPGHYVPSTFLPSEPSLYTFLPCLCAPTYGD